MKALLPILLLVSIGQLIFALVVFPAMTTTRDSDIFPLIQDERARVVIVKYHRRNQNVAKNALLLFSISTLALTAVAIFTDPKK
jgi:c-di-AMP phosphodiesterase-like protein